MTTKKHIVRLFGYTDNNEQFLHEETEMTIDMWLKRNTTGVISWVEFLNDTVIFCIDTEEIIGFGLEEAKVKSGVKELYRKLLELQGEKTPEEINTIIDNIRNCIV